MQRGIDQGLVAFHLNLLDEHVGWASRGGGGWRGGSAFGGHAAKVGTEAASYGPALGGAFLWAHIIYYLYISI